MAKKTNLPRGIYKRYGKYYISYYLQNGERIKQVIGTNLRLAESVLGKRRAEIAEGKHLDIDKKKKIKLGDFVKQFIESYSKLNKISWEDDRTRLTGLTQFLGKGMLLNRISPYHIENFKKHKLQEGVKKSTVNRYLTIIKTLFNKAIEWGNLKDNPMRSVKLFPENNCRTRFLKRDEITRLLKACDDMSNLYLKQVIIVALNTGLRYSELFNLKWCDVGFENNLIFVNKTKSTKRKILPMNSLVKKLLMNIKEFSVSEYVFPNKRIRYPFEKVLKRAGIKDCVFHTFRHTFCSHLVMNGEDLITIKELLGHASIKMVLRYSHLSEAHKRNAIERLGDSLVPFWSLEQKLEETQAHLDSEHVVNK